MALIKCSECENEISEYAKICPKCGNDNTIDNNINDKKVELNYNNLELIIVIVVVIIVGITIACAFIQVMNS